jgi:chaperonin cofactor prefoldin
MKYTVEGDRIILDLTWEEIEKIPADLPVQWEVGTGYVMPNDPEVLSRVEDAVSRPLQPRVRELIR